MRVHKAIKVTTDINTVKSIYKLDWLNFNHPCLSDDEVSSSILIRGEEGSLTFQVIVIFNHKQHNVYVNMAKVVRLMNFINN